MGRLMTSETLLKRTSALIEYLAESQEVTTSENAQDSWVRPRLKKLKKDIRALIRSAKQIENCDAKLHLREIEILVERYLFFDYAMQGFGAFYRHAIRAQSDLSYNIEQKNSS